MPRSVPFFPPAAAATLLLGVGLTAGAALPPPPAAIPFASPGVLLPGRAWEPDYLQLQRLCSVDNTLSRDAFLAAVRQFLSNEKIDLNNVDLELGSLRDLSRGAPAGWRALAQVSVTNTAGGQIRRLVFEKDYWLDPAQRGRFDHHRWAKLLWHEMHHLDAFPKNLKRADELARLFPPRQEEAMSHWKADWVALLEPMEERAAELDSIERYEAAFGPLTPELLSDSRGDMLKHAARYHRLLAQLLAQARDPDGIQATFPAELPISAQGDILPL